MTNSKHRAILLAGVAIVILGGLIAWQRTARHQAVEHFVAEVSRGRYAAATAQLTPPSALSQQADGALLIVDRHANRKVVAARQLPFMVGSIRAARPEDRITMVALGPDQNGVLQDPAVQMSIAIEQGSWHIDRVD